MRKREGRLSMSNRYMREAVQRKYLRDKVATRAIRQRLVTFAETFPANSRKLEEIPYQHLQIEDWLQLRLFLANIDTVILFYNSGLLDDFNLYWKSLGTHANPVKIYRPLLDKLEVRHHKALKYLSSFFRYIGKYDEAQGLIMRYLGTLDSNGTPQDDKRKEMAESYTSLAWIYYKSRDYDHAEEYQLKALDLHEKIGMTASRREQTNILNSLGVVYKAKGDLEKAEETHMRALALQEQVDFQEGVSWSLLNLGVVQRQRKNYKEAEVNFRRSIQIYQASVGTMHVNMSLRYNALARLYMDLEQFREAEEYFTKDLEVRKRILGPKHADLGYPMSGLAELYHKMKSYDLSESYYLQTLEIQQKALGETHPVVGECWFELGMVLEDNGKAAKASEAYTKALVILQQQSGGKVPEEVLAKLKSKLGVSSE